MLREEIQATGVALPFALLTIYAGSALPMLLYRDSPPSTGFIVATLVLGVTLIALSTIDLRTFTLPDWLTIPLAVSGLGTTHLSDNSNTMVHVLAAGSGFLVLFAVATVYRRVRGREGLGLGDAKLFAAAGAWLGPMNLPTVLLLATSGALLAALLQFAMDRRANVTEPFAFGPYLALGIWLTWLYASSS